MMKAGRTNPWYISTWLALVVAASGLAAASDAVPFDPTLPVKTLCQVPIDKLHPTQFSVGYWEVDRRAEKLAGKKSPKKLKTYLDGHLAQIVIGPGGVPYLIDGHHMSLVLLKTRISSTIDARVEANWRDLSKDEFWKKMKEHRWVYLFDNHGRGFSDPEKLPSRVTDLTDDPYRSLAWEVRNRNGYNKTMDSFAEFQWANFFRSRIVIGNGPDAFERAIDSARKISHSPEAKDLPGYEP